MRALSSSPLATSGTDTDYPCYAHIGEGQASHSQVLPAASPVLPGAEGVRKGTAHSPGGHGAVHRGGSQAIPDGHSHSVLAGGRIPAEESFL